MGSMLRNTIAVQPMAGRSEAAGSVYRKSGDNKELMG